MLHKNELRDYRVFYREERERERKRGMAYSCKIRFRNSGRPSNLLSQDSLPCLSSVSIQATRTCHAMK